MSDHTDRRDPTDADRTLYGWFADSVTRHPDQLALEAGGRQLTYAELDRLVDGYARRILTATRGVPPARVGLLADRDAPTYAAYLAVQRLEGTVVPLNPIFPAARNAAIAAAAGLDLVLAGRGGLDLDAPVLRLDPPPTAAGAMPALPPEPTDPDAVAYILFTSGSTGGPKGVPIRHRNVSAYVRHVVPRYGIGPGSRLSQTFDLTFDPSVFDMFAAWAGGAALVVPSRADLLAPVRFVNRAGITHWFSVPSIVSFAQRLRGLAPGGMPGLRWSLFAGEALTLAQAAAWQAAAPGSTVENLYGPTELTVTCTEYRLPPSTVDWPVTRNGTVPLGEVYPHLEYAVVGADGRPAAEGELCVRGPQRFPGYLDPAQDAGRFYRWTGEGFTAPAAGTEAAAEHWYRTGDLVRREGGELVHIGRIDHQLKIRGYRVELGEIEAALRARPGVADAVVLPVAAADGETDLVAVCTGAEQPAEEVLGALRSGLPPYMVPRRLQWREDLPLNLNGKTDRHALAAQLAGTPAPAAAGRPAPVPAGAAR